MEVRGRQGLHTSVVLNKFSVEWSGKKAQKAEGRLEQVEPHCGSEGGQDPEEQVSCADSDLVRRDILFAFCADHWELFDVSFLLALFHERLFGNPVDGGIGEEGKGGELITHGVMSPIRN